MTSDRLPARRGPWEAVGPWRGWEALGTCPARPRWCSSCPREAPCWSAQCRGARLRASEPQGLRTGLPLSPPSPGGRRRPRTGQVACEPPLAPAGQARAPALSRPPGPILLGVLLLLALQFPRDKPGCPFTFAMVAGGQVGSGRPSARPFASGQLSPALAVPHSRHSANARLLSSSLAQVIKTRS